MPEIADTQTAAPGAVAASQMVDLAVIRSVPGPSGVQLTNILKGAYGSYRDGTFEIDPALRKADERFLPATLRNSEAGGVAVLRVPQALLPVVKVNLAAMVRARWADMYASLRSTSQADSALGQMLDHDRDTALQAIDAILQQAGAEQAFVSPMNAQGLQVKWRSSMSSHDDNGENAIGTVPNWAIQEQPYGRMHAGVTLTSAGDVVPCPADAVFGTLEARTATHPTDVAQDRVDGVLRMRVHAPTAELARAYTNLVAQDPTMRELVFALGHPTAFQLENVGQPYAQRQGEVEQLTARALPPSDDASGPAADIAEVELPEAAQPVPHQVATAAPPLVDDGFFDPEPTDAPQQIERPRERG
ncbi:MAG: hypothetical protein E2591_26980 [Achromobacter sp.]|uniref:hypothetical protein n=1 Tax=Achromobacter sp. TaxID=134375 RepID=UPI0012C97F1D|nr:hypothetical protein [Achromobacter sp.]MPS81722.1 hypothetical protein [Achromobacter sp.]